MLYKVATSHTLILCTAKISYLCKTLFEISDKKVHLQLNMPWQK